MIKRKNFLQLIGFTLSAMLAFGTMVPKNEIIFANELENNDGIEIEIPQNTDSEYVIYLEKSAKEDNLDIINKCDSELLLENNEFSLYEADLEQQDIGKLDNQKNVVIEKNIPLSALETDLCVSDELLNDIQPENPNWNVEMIGADEVESIPDNKVKIAVMDSGIDLVSNVNVEESINLVEDEQDITPYMNDMTGHGTAVGSIIQAVNKDASIYSVRVIDKNNETNLQRVVSGIYWCIDNNIDVINMSFGTPIKSDILEMAIKDAEKAGIIVVAAAGNSGENGVDYPAAFDDTISVGAVDNNANKTKNSAVGNEIDVVAPGEEIMVETLLGMNTWVSGTSMAAPHVTAEVGLILAKDENKDKDFVEGLIKKTSKSIGTKNEYGCGVIDVNEALNQYDKYEEAYEKNNDYIYKNSNEIKTFDNNDVILSASWDKKDHESAVDNSVIKLNNSGEYDAISSTVLKVIKLGAVYPDIPKKENGNNVFSTYWHGSYKTSTRDRINYIICYKFITKIAAYAGDTDCFTKGVTNMDDVMYNSMSEKIKVDKIKGQNEKWTNWADVIGNTVYDGSDAKKTKLRKAFLYGMAIHCVTDAFAHSTFDGKTHKLIDHSYNSRKRKNADDIETCPNRFVDAQAATQRTIKLYLENFAGESSGIGNATVFFPAKVNRGTSEGYYLANVFNYALESGNISINDSANSTYKSYNDAFKYININVN